MAITDEVKVQSLIRKPVTFNDRLWTVIRQMSWIWRIRLVNLLAFDA
jgi:hypothetical protein